MENQTTQLKSTDYEENIKRWAHEDLLQLAPHFHRLKTGGTQYERTNDFVMNKVGDLPDFDNIKGDIERLRIYMALDTQDKTLYTFFPVLQVVLTTEETYYFKLHAVLGREPKHTKSAVVPELFKDVISKNWDTIDLNLIDDLFVATKIQENEFDVVLRVRYYEISKDIITEIIRNLPKITGITLYSGIDMNKFGDKTQISFTPVLGFQYDEDAKTNFEFGLKSVVELSKGEIFIEYSSPCPPTC